MRVFHKESKKHTMAKFLATQSAQAVRARLKDSTWSTYRTYAMQKKKGTYDEARVKKNTNTLENSRQKEVSFRCCNVNITHNSSVSQLLAMRAGARKGTSVEDEGCDSMFVPCAQSPQLSDAEGTGQVTRIEPMYLSKAVSTGYDRR